MQSVMRAMEARDIEAARCLLAQLSGYEMTPDEMRDRLDYANASPIDWLFVCEVDGVVRGVLGFRLREQLERVSRYGEIYMIVADEHVRRQGVGRVMMDFAEQFARTHGLYRDVAGQRVQTRGRSAQVLPALGLRDHRLSICEIVQLTHGHSLWQHANRLILRRRRRTNRSSRRC